MQAPHLASSSQVALVVRNLPVSSGNTRDMCLIPWSGRSPGGGNGNLLQYSCLEKFTDRGSWWTTVCEITKTWTTIEKACTHSILLSEMSCLWHQGAILSFTPLTPDISVFSSSNSAKVQASALAVLSVLNVLTYDYSKIWPQPWKRI